MAYAAIVSLKQTIQRLLNSPHNISPGEILQLAYKQLTSLQIVLKRLDGSSRSSSKKLSALDAQIRDQVQKLEDLLESNHSHHLSQISDLIYGDIHSFTATLKKLEEEYVKELDAQSTEDDDDDAVPSSIDFGVEMVGLSNEFAQIKNELFERVRPDDFVVYAVVGIAGSGRTVVAKNVYDGFRAQSNFDCGAWVTVGPNCQIKEILMRVLVQIVGDESVVSEEGDEAIVAECLHACLEGRRYLVVLDDVWDPHLWGYLRGSFPEENNGSVVLLTTSLQEVAGWAHIYYDRLALMTDDDAWEFLRLVMFSLDPISPEIEEAGRKIAENCRGLCIVVAKVMLFVWKAEKTLEYLNKIAAEKENPVFMVADEISEMRRMFENLEVLELLNSLSRDYKITFVVRMVKAVLGIHINDATTIKRHLFPKRLFPKTEIISIVGMAGIGKTTLAKKIYQDPSISHHFDHHAWVTLGLKYQPEEILIDILAEFYRDFDKTRMKGDEKLVKDLCSQLHDKRCLIVLDDIWKKEPLHYLKELLPNIKGKILVTTRLAEVAQFGEFDRVHQMPLLDKEESWCLFRLKVFAKELCPLELEKAGKRISENCEGLPLLILTVADLLSKSEKNPEYWDKVASDKQNSVFMDAHKEISKALLPSYKSLPQHLKACFLYMGIFPQNCEISSSKLISLWIAEGFLEPKQSQTVENFAAECLSKLVDRTLVMVRKKGFDDLKTKTCDLHSVFWYLSNNEAVKSMFFHALNTYADTSIEGIKSQRRLCIRNSILLGIKEVQNSMTAISSVHSLLCTGPPHQYPVPIYFGLMLLRIMDALIIRLYEFPIEVVKQIHLRYLALTCGGELPASISKLRSLEYLIVRRYLSIKSHGNYSYLPIEIWGMKELKHLQILGSNLPNPNYGVALPNLLTLLDVSAHSCTKRVLDGIPNLRRLGIKIELAPDDDGEPFNCLNYISCLNRLESLKCEVVNPKLKSKIVAPPAPVSMFPSGLKKLSLSGLGYPWEYMRIIGELRNLEVLKLRSYAFQGEEWETFYCSFRELKFLLIEDTDLVRWTLRKPCFKALERLSIRHCYKLQQLPWGLTHRVEMIEIVDCNPKAMAWAKNLKEQNLRSFKLQVQNSWDVRKQ